MKTNIPVATSVPPEHERSLGPHETDELAEAIAEEFDDTEHLAIYKVYCRNFPEAVIRKAHKDALSVPPDRVKRSRLALFIYLVKKYAKEQE